MIKLFEPIIDDDDVNAVVRVLRSRWLAHGPEVELFEEEFAKYIGVKYAVAVSNGTVALFLLYQAVGVGEGDKVAVPALTFVATASTVAMLRAKPVFVDIDLRTYTMDPNSLSEVLSEEVPELSVEYDVEGSVLVSPLRAAIAELANLTDTVGVTVREDAIVMYDYDTKRTQYRFSSSAGTLISLNVRKECDVAFDSEYLSKIVDILRLGSVADIKFGFEAPLNIEVTMSAGGRAQYLLAAKI